MLQHQTTPVEETASSASARVTPEELARALASLEARKDQSAREAAGTISIGEAVQQLGFDATSDEIWAEVQAQRQHQAQVVGTRLPRKTRRRLWLGVGVGLIGIVGMGFVTEARDAAPYSTVEAPTVQYVAPTAPQTVIKTPAEVPNNGTFYCDAATAQVLLRHPSAAARVLVTQGRPDTGALTDASWTFTKHDGRLYVHGYMAPRSAGAMRLGHIPIYNEDLDATGAGGANNSQAVTLPVGGFHLDGFADDGMTKDIVVSDIHPDGHFGDAW